MEKTEIIFAKTAQKTGATPLKKHRRYQAVTPSYLEALRIRSDLHKTAKGLKKAIDTNPDSL
ncbi:MAG: hypothetical protein GY701_26510, partial [Sulfitobacter sp.]|nr:hypothetical protein [Sulfitobacter sp.]